MSDTVNDPAICAAAHNPYAELAPCTVLRPETSGEHDWQVALTGRCLAGSPTAPSTARERHISWIAAPLLAAGGFLGVIALSDGASAGLAAAGLLPGVIPFLVRAALGLRRDARLSVSVSDPQSVRLVIRAQAALQSLDGLTGGEGFAYLRPAALQAYRELLDELTSIEALLPALQSYQEGVEALPEGDPDRAALACHVSDTEDVITTHRDEAMSRVAGLEALVKEITAVEREGEARALAGAVTGAEVLRSAARQQLQQHHEGSLASLTDELLALRAARAALTARPPVFRPAPARPGISVPSASPTEPLVHGPAQYAPPQPGTRRSRVGD